MNNTKIIKSLFMSAAVASACTGGNNKTNADADVMDSIVADTLTTVCTATYNRDTAIYEMPGYSLWYTCKLPAKYMAGGSRMWTEHETYQKSVNAVNVFVANTSDTTLTFGRKWSLYFWNGREWTGPETRGGMIIWEDDLAISDEAPLLYCFRFPVGEYYCIRKGKYMITKDFVYTDGKELVLKACFDVR